MSYFPILLRIWLNITGKADYRWCCSCCSPLMVQCYPQMNPCTFRLLWVVYDRGCQNIIADSLSQMFEGYPDSGDSVELPAWNHIVWVGPILCEVPLAYEGIEEAQERDPELKAIRDRIKGGEDCMPHTIKNDILLCTARHDKKVNLWCPKP